MVKRTPSRRSSMVPPLIVSKTSPKLTSAAPVVLCETESARSMNELRRRRAGFLRTPRSSA
jgi:hypothetical protein